MKLTIKKLKQIIREVMDQSKGAAGQIADDEYDAGFKDAMFMKPPKAPDNEYYMKGYAAGESEMEDRAESWGDY